MEAGDDREVRAGRNQALFRAVNEKMRELNETFAAVVGTYAIACECADTMCTGILEIAPPEYMEIRRNPRHFAVLPGHVYPDVETVVSETVAYVVVEKIGRAAGIVEELVPEASGFQRGDE